MSPSKTKALVELLTSLFTTDELYRFAAFLPHGNLTSALPSAPASLDAVAFEMVQVLERRGQLDGEFFYSTLEEERPGRRAELTQIRRLILDSKTQQFDIIDFTGERGRHEHFFGRQDILREFDEWLESRQSGWLLLTGSPGLGKSAIFNHWLGLREQAGLPTAFHFIRRRNVRKVDRRVSSRLPAVESAAWTEAFAADDRSRPAAAALRPPAGSRSAGARRCARGSRSVRPPSHWLAAQ